MFDFHRGANSQCPSCSPEVTRGLQDNPPSVDHPKMSLSLGGGCGTCPGSTSSSLSPWLPPAYHWKQALASKETKTDRLLPRAAFLREALPLSRLELDSWSPLSPFTYNYFINKTYETQAHGWWLRQRGGRVGPLLGGSTGRRESVSAGPGIKTRT